MPVSLEGHDDISKTLQQRGGRYGDIADNSQISQAIKQIARTHPASKWSEMSAAHKECFEMIAHKLARFVCGDVNYTDTLHDIAGYATLLEKYINQNEGNPEDLQKEFDFMKNLV